MKALATERKPDFTVLRRDFPIFERTVYGKPLIYLDSTATGARG
jgi:selenocysteine lyase/cysteine desulfurase